jgi:hypothetical protein
MRSSKLHLLALTQYVQGTPLLHLRFRFLQARHLVKIRKEISKTKQWYIRRSDRVELLGQHHLRLLELLIVRYDLGDRCSV